MGLASVLRDGARLLRRTDPLINFIVSRIKPCLFTVAYRNMGPELLATGATPISHMKRNHLAGGGIHGTPDPLFVRHCSKAPEFDVDRAGTPFYTTAPHLFP